MGILVVSQLAAPTDAARLLAHARLARYQQDSTLAAYQTIVRQRASAGIGLTRGLVGQVGRPRLAARYESVARVGWHHERGAWAEILAARGVAPIVGENEPEPGDDDQAIVVPYYPGRDRLWPVSEIRAGLPELGKNGTVGAGALNEWILHPLETGAEREYSYAAGDSLSLRLPDGSIVKLRELRVRPRRPDAQLIVGSLWIDDASGALVRAAYRPSMPMDLWPLFGPDLDDNQRENIRQLGPFLGTVREVIIEHGLYEKRFWLPRARIASAEGTARLGRVTVDIEQTFTYEKVAALAPGEPSKYRPPSPDIDPRDGRVRRPRWRGVEYETRPPGDRIDRWPSPREDSGYRCRRRGDSTVKDVDSIAANPGLTVMWAEGVRLHVMFPCRITDLANSPLLPPSIYDKSEELFTESDLSALRRDVEGALTIGSQAEWEPQPPTLHYGLEKGLIRYNRVEGVSAGALVERVLGNGYTGSAQARLGVADLEPNGELTLTRSNASREVRFSVYRRLAAANDWGEPLGMGASVVAAVFGRDDGFYYRTLGGEVGGSFRGGVSTLPVAWRLFVERHDSAAVETQASLANWIGDAPFLPNIQARPGFFGGGAAGVGFQRGLDPQGTRLSGALRAEAAGGESAFGRLALDLTLTHGFGTSILGTLTTAGGAAAGELPAQRLWYIGGAHTVRGHRAGSNAGDAFWLGRLELAKGHPLVRPTMFADIGWAGSRDSLASALPLAGAGAGASILDGMLRLDVARRIGDRGVGNPWRLEFYFEVR